MPLQNRAEWGYATTKVGGGQQFCSWGVRRPQLPHTVSLLPKLGIPAVVPATAACLQLRPCFLFFQGHGGDNTVRLDRLFWHLPAHCTCIFLLCWMLIQDMPIKWPQRTGLLLWSPSSASSTTLLEGAFHF